MLKTPNRPGLTPRGGSVCERQASAGRRIRAAACLSDLRVLELKRTAERGLSPRREPKVDMDQASPRVLIACVAALSFSDVACLPDQRNCERSLVVGDRLLMRVGPALEAAAPCDPALGITPSRVIESQVTAFDGGSGCASALVMADALDDWQIEWRDQEADGSQLLEAHYRLVRGDCSGSLHLGVTSVPVPTPPLDSTDAAELRVSYLADRDLSGCPLSCSARHSVQVERR